MLGNLKPGQKEHLQILILEREKMSSRKNRKVAGGINMHTYNTVTGDKV